MESIEVPKALRKLGFKVTFEVWCFKEDKQHERGKKTPPEIRKISFTWGFWYGFMKD